MPRAASAQHITIDGRFSPGQTLIGPNYAIGANLGRQVGSNLFHSFGVFGLATGESAAFSGPATISNVIGRVTGGNPSAIDGKIQSNIAGANLYLINPSGIVFGRNATVNVSGSFHAATADNVTMSDGSKFQAANPDDSTLTTAPPVMFGFLMARPAALTVNGGTLGPLPGRLDLASGSVLTIRAEVSALADAIYATTVSNLGELATNVSNAGLGSGISAFVSAGGLSEFGAVFDSNRAEAGHRRGGRLARVIPPGRTEVLREACHSHGSRPISTLAEAGRGGLPLDPDATLPALYSAGRDLNPNLPTALDTAELNGAPVHTTARLRMHCN